MTRLLIHEGADIENICRIGQDGWRTVLHFATTNGYETITQILIDMGADLDSTGYCSTNSRDIHKFWNTTWRITPLHLAVALLLTDKGANIEAEGSSDGAC